jgi:hypothetical protein
MSPRRTRQPPTHNLSWFSVPRRRATLRQAQGIDKRNCCRLERFRHHIRAHNIPYFCASHQVYVKGPHSCQYFRTSLRSLLTLDYTPWKVKIPVLQLPHDCIFCPEVTSHIFQRRRPFDYIIAIPRSRGRPRQDTPEELDSSESDSDDSDLLTDNDPSDISTSTQDRPPLPPPGSPPIPEPCLSSSTP